MVVVLVNGVLFSFENQERSFLLGEELGADFWVAETSKGAVPQGEGDASSRDELGLSSAKARALRKAAWFCFSWISST